jgi:hypothetical protein
MQGPSRVVQRGRVQEIGEITNLLHAAIRRESKGEPCRRKNCTTRRSGSQGTSAGGRSCLSTMMRQRSPLALRAFAGKGTKFVPMRLSLRACPGFSPSTSI